MKFLVLYWGWVLMLFSWLGFLLHRSHVMSLMIILETMLLSCLVMVSLVVSLNLLFNWIILVLLLIMVCEGALGMGLLVLLSRSYGLEEIKSLSLLKC